MPVHGDEWEAQDKAASRARGTPTAWQGSTCVFGKHCWGCWGTLLGVGLYPDPCQFPWHQPPRQDELHQCSAPAQPQSWEVVPALISQNPIKLGRPFKPNCAGTAEHSLYVKGGALCTSRRGAAAFPRKLLKVLQQRGRCQPWHAFLLVLLPRPLRSTPVIPWGPASQAELSPSQFYYWVVKKPKKRGWIAAMPFQWLTPLFLYVYCYNKSLQSFCRCYIS